MIKYKDFKDECGIYCFTNKINSKCYVGQAINLKNRLRSHYSAFKNQNIPNMIFYSAVAKYGVENFDLSILEYIDSTLDKVELKKILDEREKFYIQEKNSYVPNGYNQTLGGDAGVLGYKMTEKQKEKIREGGKKSHQGSMKFVYGWNFSNDHEYMAINSKIMSEITGIARSNISHICNGGYLHDWCKTFTFAFSKDDLYNKRDKIRILINNGLKLSENSGNFGAQPPKFTGIAVVEIDKLGNVIQEFESIKEVARNINRSINSVSDHLRGLTKKCAGRCFRYKNINYKPKKRGSNGVRKMHCINQDYKKRPVVAYNLDGTFYKEFDSVKKAAIELANGDRKGVERACSGKLKTSHKFIWKYK